MTEFIPGCVDATGVGDWAWAVVAVATPNRKATVANREGRRCVRNDDRLGMDSSFAEPALDFTGQQRSPVARGGSRIGAPTSTHPPCTCLKAQRACKSACRGHS